MTKYSVLVVEDESDVRKTLKSGLSAEGYVVFEAWDRTTMFACFRDHDVSIVTLDLNLVGEDGLDLACELRGQRNVPVVMISGRSAPYDRVRGLEYGADDYIVKPFHIKEVAFRIRKTLERYQKHVDPPAKVLFDHSELDLRQKIVRHLDGTPLDLTEMEIKLLELFVRHPGRILSRDEISNALRGRDWSPYDRTIDGHVARLRRKIEPPGEAPTLIRSVRGVGYVFSGEVTTNHHEN
ncbi:winged helix-turn-helix domain-containing protein [Roseovarius salis]|uniref:response regulator transcription factor n=1 Tax=Roseovarius salis TaxID=3376063 RepID=UPI0037C9DCC3